MFGQSAGALSALIHLSSRKADNLYQRAIIQSGPFSIPFKSFRQAYSQGAEFSRNLNCPPGDIVCMRSRSPREILDAQASTRSFGNVLQQFMPWSPYHDGDEVPVSPLKAIEKGLIANKSLIIGTTADEGLTYVYNMFPTPLNMMTYSGLLLMINQNEAFTWLSRYSPKNPRDSRAALSSLATDYLFTCPTRQIASDLALSNHNLWLYVFDQGMSFLNGNHWHSEQLSKQCMPWSRYPVFVSKRAQSVSSETRRNEFGKRPPCVLDKLCQTWKSKWCRHQQFSCCVAPVPYYVIKSKQGSDAPPSANVKCNNRLHGTFL